MRLRRVTSVPLRGFRLGLALLLTWKEMGLLILAVTQPNNPSFERAR